MDVRPDDDLGGMRFQRLAFELAGSLRGASSGALLGNGAGFIAPAEERMSLRKRVVPMSCLTTTPVLPSTLPGKISGKVSSKVSTTESSTGVVSRRPFNLLTRPMKPAAMLYLRPLRRMGPVLQFQAFDADYIEALRAGDRRTQEHFVCYFTDLLHLKLRSRLRSPQAIEDVRQETFSRVLAAVQKEGSLRQPDRLGPFVNTVCNNVLLEHYRQAGRNDSLDDEGEPEPAAKGESVLETVQSKEMAEQVRKVLEGLGEQDRSLLKAVFIDERDREEVCREFGVDRDYLRVLLHRAKQVFKTAYLKRSGNHLPFASPGEA